MKVVRVKNSELDDPYCYEYWDSQANTWVGIGIYDPEENNIIDDYILFDEEGFVYAETPDGLNGTPIEMISKEDWEKYILQMAGSPEYPSAELIDTHTGKVIIESYAEKMKRTDF